MSPPWMPLYIGDYLSDTGHLTAAQHGAYLLLIMHYWRNGKLPAETKQKASIARMRLEDWNRNVEVIQAFFEIDEGGAWRHARILAELERCREKRTKRAEAGRLGGLEKARKNSSNATNLLKQNPTNHNHSHKEEERKKLTKKETGADRAAHMPKDFALTAADEQFAIDRGWDRSRIASQFERFCDHAKANGRRQIDWHASWRTWVTSPFQTKANGSAQHYKTTRDVANELIEELRAAPARPDGHRGGINGNGSHVVGLPGNGQGVFEGIPHDACRDPVPVPARSSDPSVLSGSWSSEGVQIIPPNRRSGG